VIWKDSKPYVFCLIRNKEILLKPEETVRQLYIVTLMEDFKYPKSRIKLEYPVHFGREKRAKKNKMFRVN